MLVGAIGKPHGTAGEVYVERISDDPHRFDPGSRIAQEDGATLEVESSRPHRGGRFLVKFAGIESRAEAESLRGLLYVDAGSARTLDADEYWTHLLPGCRVETLDGTLVGEALRVIPAPAQDLLAVGTERGERLVPIVKEIVHSVDLDERRIVLDPPEGLLD